MREQLELTESATGLYDAIHALPGRQFNAIVIRYVLGYSTKQVARFMGLDERTAGYHLREAKKRLATQLRVDLRPTRKSKNTKSTQSKGKGTAE
ncbi:sigma factor-like helix-turn-helix DNA-binding protein [Streptomyces sp. NBC_01497]|uniref:sigma factor-like helix-turn-helix DNA-binding protein n=1 Tax=Streptomyces sp. NBC_01497 TaxID=2903885 RepID=UPI002E3430C3|nr:sigma factor-like helix-turn-helix DNA-binding protein [Streptomyces sp. NBC_01497]